MRSLVTGAAGFIGLRLVELLVERWGGNAVQAAVGPPQHAVEQARLNRLGQLGVAVVPMDLRRVPVFSRPPAEFDTLFHLAAYVRAEHASPDVHINDRGAGRMLAELGAGLRGRRLVYTSSIAAVDPSPPHPGLITNNTPCHPRTPYGASKLAAEKLLVRSAARYGFNYTILRLPTVYGPGFRSGGMFARLADLLPRQSFATRIAWPGRMSIMEVEDVARLLACVAAHPGAADRTFLASSGEDPTMAQIVECAAHLLGVPHRPIELPPWLLALLGLF